TAPRAEAPAAQTATATAAPSSVAQLVASARRSIVVVGTPRGLGTGFVVAKSVVATNLHVVAGNDRILVALEGRKPVPVSGVLGFDAVHDLVLLSVPDLGDAVPALSIETDGALNPGDAVVAIGTPQGLEFTVSTGIV